MFKSGFKIGRSQACNECKNMIATEKFDANTNELKWLEFPAGKIYIIFSNID